MTNEEYNGIMATAGVGLSLLGKASALLPNLMTRELTDEEKGRMKSFTCLHRSLCPTGLGCSMCGRYEIDKQKAKDDLEALTEQVKELNAKRLFLQLKLTTPLSAIACAHWNTNCEKYKENKKDKDNAK